LIKPKRSLYKIYWVVGLPLFQLNSFFRRPFSLGLKGPCSTKAPAPTEEQPGPSKPQKHLNCFFH